MTRNRKYDGLPSMQKESGAVLEKQNEIVSKIHENYQERETTNSTLKRWTTEGQRLNELVCDWSPSIQEWPPGSSFLESPHPCVPLNRPRAYIIWVPRLLMVPGIVFWYLCSASAYFRVPPRLVCSLGYSQGVSVPAETCSTLLLCRSLPTCTSL